MSNNNVQKKAVKKAAKAAAVRELSMMSPGGGAALAAAQSIRAVTKKSKSKSPWLGLLSGAAKVAADLIPVVAPLFLAGHGPTQARAAMAGVQVPGAAAAAAGAPVASGMGVTTMTGLYKMTSLTSAGGRVTGVRIIGLDFLGDVTCSSAVTEGSVIFTAQLNPLSSDWRGTRAQREASLYERYNFKRCALLYQPGVPATQPGQLVAFIDTDPTDTDFSNGKSGVQKATAHAGAEVGQVWQVICAQYCPDKSTQDFYADPSGSDLRLISAGNAVVQAASDLAAGTYGGIYIAYELELRVPQLEMVGGVNPLWAVWTSNTTGGALTTAAPLGPNLSYSQLRTSGTIDAYYLLVNGTNWGITGLPPGQFLVSWRIGSAASTSPVLFNTDNVNYTQSVGTSTATATTANGMALLTVKSDTKGNASLGNCYFTTTTNAPTVMVVYVAQFDPTLTAAKRKKMSLQDYERGYSSMREELDTIKTALARVQPQRPVSRTSDAAESPWAGYGPLP